MIVVVIPGEAGCTTELARARLTEAAVVSNGVRSDIAASCTPDALLLCKRCVCAEEENAPAARESMPLDCDATGSLRRDGCLE